MSSLLSSLPTLEHAQTSNLVDEEVQHLFEVLGQVSPEARTQFVVKLLQGLAGKVNNTLATETLKLAQSQEGRNGTKGNTAGTTRNKKPEPWPGGGRLELADSLDPVEGWNRFGQDAYYRILYYETLPILESILIHPNMPMGKRPKGKATSANLAKNIIERLEENYGKKSS